MQQNLASKRVSFGLIASIAVSTFALAVPAAHADEPLLVIEGSEVAGIHLGDSKQQVEQQLGASQSCPWYTGCVYYLNELPGIGAENDREDARLAVIYDEQETVSQLRVINAFTATTEAGFRHGGFGAIDEFLATYPNATVRNNTTVAPTYTFAQQFAYDVDQGVGYYRSCGYTRCTAGLIIF